MGDVQTVELKGKDIQKDQFKTKFTNDELQGLFRNFKSLDANNDGFLSKEEFLQIEALQQNPLVTRVLEIFDDDGNDKIDFSEFVHALSIFCANDQEEKDAKVKFAFRIYDVDNNGYISNGDLFRILKIMVGDNLNDTQLQQLVDRTVLQADKDKDGKLSLSEFQSFIANSDIESKLVIDLAVANQM
eukprot:CAMPEP_0201591794 /NCGR_PEP_ID=MMETSP0190_2-20130828/189868_1 /ASSEMBLY_ACC=CAM_ASM_000263 /TAXON_ID=37353 /ORGANISM="Rosalina sp." /LENGTH=186 /DNA_ID=CAMNT_0048050273 /DNA_START=77 /DNA_END=637 /DNA_ORIENTATION=-